jgi:hypothetical protein
LAKGGGGGKDGVGSYRISAIHFGRMAIYLAKGGLFGWIKERKPEFSEPTIQAIRESRNPLYKEIKRSLIISRRP